MELQCISIKKNNKIYQYAYMQVLQILKCFHFLIKDELFLFT